MRVRAYAATDLAWAEKLVGGFGGRDQARRGETIDVLDLPGFVVEESGEPAGLATYRIQGPDCELVFIEVRYPHSGAGTALLEAVVDAARGCRRIWVVTTNDNLTALRFYQRRGFRLRELRPGAVDRSRDTIKPSLPVSGDFGIPLRDELELERVLD